MNAARKVWPLCPRPHADESLHSWFERIGHEYHMSPALLLGAVEQEAFGQGYEGDQPLAIRLLDPAIALHLKGLGQVSAVESTGLWPPRSTWHLADPSFITYCPHCCLGDLAVNRTPYGRRLWQEAWCTVCSTHGTALMMRNVVNAPRGRPAWSRVALKHDGQYLAANRYRDLKVGLQPIVRPTIFGCLMEIQRTVAAANTNVAPNAWSWGKLTSQEFLTILQDVTTWGLTHFEPVTAWSVAEDLAPTEEQEGYGLIGRARRMSSIDYKEGKTCRNLVDVTNPKVRGAALWMAHALMAMCHVGTTDRASGTTTQERQHALLSRGAPGGRRWLAQRQAVWPNEYRRARWINVADMA